MTELINLNNEQKYTSLYLVEQINIYRKEEGGNDLHHSDFLKKIRLEFEEEVNEGKISSVDYKDKKGEMRKSYELTFEQSLQILMSESKTVRKRVIEVLKKQQETIKNLTPVFKVPQTFKEALLLAVEQQEIIEKQEQLLLEQKPKVEFYDQVADTTRSFDMREVSAMLQLPYGRNKLFAELRNREILMDDNMPYRTYIDKGYFVVVETKWLNTKTETYMAEKQTRVTQKGLEYLQKKLK
jgi:phage antirepressor YoqD-like protein